MLFFSNNIFPFRNRSPLNFQKSYLKSHGEVRWKKHRDFPKSPSKWLWVILVNNSKTMLNTMETLPEYDSGKVIKIFQSHNRYNRDIWGLDKIKPKVKVKNMLFVCICTIFSFLPWAFFIFFYIFFGHIPRQHFESARQNSIFRDQKPVSHTQSQQYQSKIKISQAKPKFGRRIILSNEALHRLASYTELWIELTVANQITKAIAGLD